MLLLYTRLLRQNLTREKSSIQPDGSRLSQSKMESTTELEREGFTRTRQGQQSEVIRKIESEYHLERRFLL